MKLKTGYLLLLPLLLIASSACIFGGGDDDGDSPGARTGPIPTATLPATMTDPVLLGQGAATTGEGDGGPNIPGGASGEVYVVESGDTLGAIAAGLGIPGDQQAAWIAEVQRLNDLTDPRQIAVGQELLLPLVEGEAAADTTATPAAGTATATPGAGTGAATATPSAAATATPASASGGGGTYTVESGDNPFAIGTKLGVPASELAAWSAELTALNGISETGLNVGQVLELPASTP